ncbi:MAG: hypothetical protein KBC26_00130 [Candidatus Pacebacteria bacterium]|nr:hypothetical protein [Candidatus Paceibacterota bacterium]
MTGEGRQKMSYSTQTKGKMLPLPEQGLSVSELSALVLYVASGHQVVRTLKEGMWHNDMFRLATTARLIGNYFMLPKALTNLFDNIAQGKRIDPIPNETTLEKWRGTLNALLAQSRKLYEERSQLLRDLGGTCNIP